MKTKELTKVFLVLGLAVGLVYATPVVAAEESEEPVEIEFQGEVLDVDGYVIVTKMIPSGNVRTFHPAEGREVIVDGETITADQLKVGTVLSAKVMVYPSEQVMETVSGSVKMVVGRTVVIRHDDGSVKNYTVDTDFTFDVDGKPTTVQNLRPHTKLTATRITADPATVITPDTPVYGKAPK